MATQPRITHTVLFRFKVEAPAARIKNACTQFLALQDLCVHPARGERYILSLKGGRDISTEKLQDGITHGFVVEFASVEDRDYYVEDDPQHKAFVNGVEDLLEKAIVIDFRDGEY